MPAPSGHATPTGSALPLAKPRRFFGSVEIDMNRPVKAFDAIISAVVMELQRSPGANTKQLKFTPGSTGFEG